MSRCWVPAKSLSSKSVTFNVCWDTASDAEMWEELLSAVQAGDNAKAEKLIHELRRRWGLLLDHREATP